jgi:putative chitinase
MTPIQLYQQSKGLKPDGVIGKVTLAEIKKDCNIANDIQLAHFMGQCHHETGGFRLPSENLNYDSAGLRKVFSKYFPTDILAAQYTRQPMRIANRVYASRMGNGNEASGDGWRFRGRGAIQLTGKSNYQAFSNYVKDLEIISNPDIVATKYFFKSAEFFFNCNNLWLVANKGIDGTVIRELTKKINGGTHGIEDRIRQTNLYYSILSNI